MPGATAGPDASFLSNVSAFASESGELPRPLTGVLSPGATLAGKSRVWSEGTADGSFLPQKSLLGAGAAAAPSAGGWLAGKSMVASDGSAPVAPAAPIWPGGTLAGRSMVAS